jgi:hypothetical protein
VFIEDVLNAFYSCIILHNMVVTERILQCEDDLESTSFNDCIIDTEDDTTAHVS